MKQIRENAIKQLQHNIKGLDLCGIDARDLKNRLLAIRYNALKKKQ